MDMPKAQKPTALKTTTPDNSPTTKVVTTTVATSTTSVPSTTNTTSTPNITKIKDIVASIPDAEMTPEQCCEKAGLTLDVIYSTLAEMMKAETCIKSRNEELWIPDNRTRMAAVALTLELRKHIKDKTTVTQVGIFNDPKVIEEAQRVLALRDRV